MSVALEGCERESKCEGLFNHNTKNIFLNRGGTTGPLPKDRGAEELHGDPTVGPRSKVWTRGQQWKK